jgi:hypothetical protein
MQELLGKSRIRPNSDAVSCELAGETVILDMASGRYFALDEVGTKIWEWIQTPCTVESLCERLLAEYEVNPATCREDVSILLKQLAEYGLVKLDDGQEA